jgi:hypothetical protein
MMFDINQTQHSLRYNFIGGSQALLPLSAGTAKSADAMDDLLTQILSGHDHRFICSQFVVYVYQFAGSQCGMSPSQLFTGNDARVSPSTLAVKLQHNAFFKEIGYMLPNDR